MQLTRTRHTLYTLTTALTAAGLITLNPTRTLAFSLQDDPNSSFINNNVTQIETGTNNNTRLIRGFQVTSAVGSPTRSIGVVNPYLWPLLPDGTPVKVSFRNDLGGWFTDNYDNTNTSLLVKLANFSQRVPVGTIANNMGNQSLPLTSNCQFSENPSCIEGPRLRNFPVQTLTQTDEVPFLDLGIFSPGETKSFDLAVQYEFSDNRAGAPRVSIVRYTVTPVPEPEPGLMTFGLALFLGIQMLKKRKH